MRLMWHLNLQQRETHPRANISLSGFHTHSGHILHWVESLMRQATLWSLVLPSGAPLAPQTTSWYHQLNHRSSLGHTDNSNLIFLILPRLLSSLGFRHKPCPPPFFLFFVSPTEALTALSFTLHPHPLITLCSTNLITTLLKSAGAFLADHLHLFLIKSNRYLLHVCCDS